jgi:tripartite-type tricarboxylate transporter receptor subunit TctC
VTTTVRAKARPDLPTIAESGFPGFDISTWYAYWAPKGTPADIIEKLAASAAQALKNPEVIAKYEAMGAEPVGSTPAQFAAYVESEAKKWNDIVKKSGAKLD